jgi:hypothetical protein
MREQEIVSIRDYVDAAHSVGVDGRGWRDFSEGGVSLRQAAIFWVCSTILLTKTF